MTSIEPFEIFQLENGHQILFAGVFALQVGDHATDGTELTVAELLEFRDGAVAFFGAERLRYRPADDR